MTSVLEGGTGAKGGPQTMTRVVFDDPALQQLLEQVLPQSPPTKAQLERLERYESVERPARETPLLLVAPLEWRHGEAVVMIRRRTEPAPRDLVVVDAARIDAAVLHAALETLVTVRMGSGACPREDSAISISTTARSTPFPALWEQHLQQVIEKLSKQHECAIDDEGVCRVLEFRISY